MLAPALTQPGAVVVDCTLGLGGHSEALLTRFPEVRLIGLDRDKEATLFPYTTLFRSKATSRTT